MNKLNFNNIIEMPLSKLIQISMSGDIFESDDCKIYLQILIYYLKNETTALSELLEKKQMPTIIRLLGKMRLLSRTEQLTLEASKNAYKQLLSFKADSSYMGEFHFIMGYAFYSKNKHLISKDHYQKAAAHFEEAKCFKKAVRSKSNVLVAKTILYPNRKYIPDYHAIYLQAKKVREHSTCGTAMMNLSREYQKMGSLTTALKMINKAIAHFSVDVGAIHFYLALVHRAQIQLSLGNTTNALEDIETALTCNFDQVHQAVKVLERIDTSNLAKTNIKALNPSWRERMLKAEVEKVYIDSFTSTEQLLLRILAKGALQKAEAIERLYGKQADFESLDARFKNLLSRIRKKSPNLITYSDGFYEIQDADIKQACS